MAWALARRREEALSPPRTDISTDEGNALRELVFTHISGIDDLAMACQVEDFEQAERLGVEFGDQLRLMEDLGWSADPKATAHKLTMPPEQLQRVFTRLRAAVETLRADERREEAEVEEEARAFRERARRVTEACDRVLSALAEK